MVEHTVQHHPDARRVQRRAHARKIRVRTKAAVQLRIVPGIVAVSVGFKHRAEIHRVRPQLFDMGHPVQQLQNTRLRSAIVFPRRAAQAQRIDLVKHAFFKPHHGVTPFLRAARSAWGALCRSGSRDSLFFSIPISKLTLRVPLVFTKKQGIYAARLMLRLRPAFVNRTYYTITPRSGLNKTASIAVLHGSMFSKPCAPAQGRVPCTRAAAQAAALRL